MTEPSPYSAELRNLRRLGKLLMLLTVVLMGVLVVYAWPLARNWWEGPNVFSRPVTPRGELAPAEQSTIALFRSASPSVAFITTDIRAINRRTRSIEDVPQGAGSGFVWDTQGHIVTNFHVIQNASAAHVILFDQTTYDAQILGADPANDLAVLKISPPLGISLVPIPIGKSSDAQVGQSVFAIGNPFGLDQSLTTGVISAIKRTITGIGGNPIEDVIQTDAAINPGNSGGPLLDSAGRIIGMNTSIYSPSGSWSGIGFAIPVDTVNRVVPKIIATGHYSRARLGIQFDDALSQRLLSQRRSPVVGLVIIDVEPNSPAEKAGLIGLTRNPRGFVIGDVITAINGRQIKSSADVFTALDPLTPGDIVDVTILRNNQVQHVQVKTE